MRNSGFSAPLAIFSFLTLSGIVGAAGPEPVHERGRFILLDANASKQFARLTLNPKLSIDYGSFSVVELEEPDFATLKASGIAYHDQSHAYSLILGESRFDPLFETPSVPAAWAAQPRAGGKDFRLVQFVGPIKQEWLDRLAADGIEIVQYLHPHTYVVFAESTAVANQRAAEVRWVGDFLPAYKVLPKWRALAAEPVATKVMVYRSADSQRVLESVKVLGGKLDRVAKSDPAFDVATFMLPGDKFAEVASIAGVYSIQPLPTDGGLRGEMSNQVNANNVDGSNLAFPGYLTWLAGIGLSGAGVRIANVDGGVQDTHPNLVNRFVPCSGTTCSGTSSSHGTHTSGIMAADGTSGVVNSFGFQRGLGVAPGANLVEQVYSPWFQNPGGMLLLMTDSYNNGASVSGNSWGPAGTPQGYDDDTRQCDVGVRDADPNAAGNEPLSFVLSFMNGNGGTSSQGSPDEAKNLFTIGSTKMQNSGSGSQILQIDDLSSNSAHGPALDGRKIPHMVAPGCYIDSTLSTNTYGLNCGTSMASPHVSGAVALFIDYYRDLPGYASDPSPALVKAAFLPVSHDLAGHLDADGGTLGHPFDNKQGWGRMDLEAVVDPPNSVLYFDNPVVLNNTGEQWIRNVSAEDPSKPIRIMLVWTDAPGHGLGGSAPAWNNNLNLTVEEGANIYRGNVFNASGWSVTGGAADDRNNTEGVFIGPTAPNGYTLRVTAANINSDGIPNSGDATDQDFAVVCYNCAQEPTFTLAATPASQTLCAPADAVYTIDVGAIMGFNEPVHLSASGNSGGATVGFGSNTVFPPGSTSMTISNTGAASAGSYDILVTGISGATVRNSTVRLNLYTASPGAPSLLSPGNGASNQALRPNFTWSAATQAATYTIEIATDAGFNSIVQSASGLISPAFTPSSDLAIATPHYWRVRATNPCGTGPNSSAFSFTTRSIPPILLVDDDDNAPDVRSTYTTALAALGKSYDVWNTNNTDNEPNAADLSPYQVVIWFTGDEFGGFCGPGAAGETALATWLNTGKHLWMVSQDYLYDRDSPTGVPTSFMQNYLGCASLCSNDVSQTNVTGQNLFSGLGPYALSYPFTNFSDRISPNGTALLAFTGNAGSPPEAAIYKNSGYKTVFFGFPWEAIPTPAARQTVMQRILDWFLCSSAINLAPATLPSTFVGRLYNRTITASGGTGPHNFTVTAGSVPPGLTLSANGALSGVTTQGGTFNFTVTATDTFGCQGSKAYSVVVRVKPIDPI